MISDEEYKLWLREGGRRALIVRVGGDKAWWSTVPYTTLPTDTPPNQPCLPIVQGGVEFNSELSLNGSAKSSTGDIELNNLDGDYDYLLNEVWPSQSIEIYIGDITWMFSDFRMVFKGVVDKMDSAAAGSLNLVIRDPLDRLDEPVTEEKLGGETVNKDHILPVTIGLPFNVSPLMVDETQEQFQVNIGATEDIVEMRSNGIPISITKDLANGKFKMLTDVYGTITGDVQGVAPYVNDIASAIKLLVTSYGNAAKRFTEDEIDLENFEEFRLAHPDPIGVYISDTTDVSSVCKDLAGSLGAQLVATRLGKLRLHQLTTEGYGEALVITEADYVENSLAISEITDVVAAYKLGYCKNWTVQTEVADGVPPAHAEIYAREWLTVTATNQEVAELYKLSLDAEQKDTLLIKTSSATAEAQRLLDLFSVPRTVFTMTCYDDMTEADLGRKVQLFGSRWGLEEGKFGTIVGLSTDWIEGRTTVKVFV